MDFEILITFILSCIAIGIIFQVLKIKAIYETIIDVRNEFNLFRKSEQTNLRAIRNETRQICSMCQALTLTILPRKEVGPIPEAIVEPIQLYQESLATSLSDPETVVAAPEITSLNG